MMNHIPISHHQFYFSMRIRHSYIQTYMHTYIHTYHAHSLEHVGEREIGNVNIVWRGFKHGLLQQIHNSHTIEVCHMTHCCKVGGANVASLSHDPLL